jgi:hypothetical protein
MGTSRTERTVEYLFCILLPFTRVDISTAADIAPRRSYGDAGDKCDHAGVWKSPAAEGRSMSVR